MYLTDNKTPKYIPTRAFNVEVFQFVRRTEAHRVENLGVEVETVSD